MSTISISEYKDQPIIVGHQVAVGVEPATIEQTITSAVGSVAGSAFDADTVFVRVHNSGAEPVSMKFGASPTAIDGEKRLAAGATEFFGVVPGLGHTLAVINTT